ncbi:MAG: winged helix-turn-helix transcriptional regulator [Deltaproteobacteria bacterium]|nr:winged helix-turn-helix transcriptional regulator [Deltaproteobacteria bacterium]
MKPRCCTNKKNSQDIRKTAEFLKIITEENRLKILCILQEEELCVLDIWQYLTLPQNLTSHHLKVLKDFNLIASRKAGLRVFYSINKKVLNRYSKLLNKFLNLCGE